MNVRGIGTGILLVGIVAMLGGLLAEGRALPIDGERGTATVERESFRAFVTDRHLGLGNPAWAEFEAAHPGEWRTQWDTRTGIPHLVYGDSIDVGKPIGDEASALEVALDVIAEHGMLFGLDGFDFTIDARHGGHMWYVDATLYHDAIAFAEYTRFAIRLHDLGKISALKAYDIPWDVEGSAPSVAAADAIEVAMDSVPSETPGTLRRSEPALSYLTDADGRARLVWRFEIRSDDTAEPFGHEYFVRAHDAPAIVTTRDLIHHDHAGSVAANVLLQGPSDGSTNVPLVDAGVTVTSGGSGTEFTDANGDFNFVGGSGTVTIRSRLDGRWVDVNNQGGADSEISITAGEGNNFHFDHASTAEFDLAEQNAMYWVTDLHNWASGVMDGNSGIEFTFPANVNGNTTCNAFYDGTTIHFARANGPCPNTAYSDVILHEGAHGIDDNHGSIMDGALGEGFADAVSMARTDQPCMGRDFLGPETCIRNGENVRMWPANECNGQIHCVSEVFSQFTWELAKNLKLAYGQAIGRSVADSLILLPAIANPVDIPDAVLEMFIADDENGNLGDGSANYVPLAAAAGSRNLPFPAADPLVLTLTPDPTVSGQLATVTLQGADGGSRVVIYFTRGRIDFGNGPCPAELGGLCLDIVGNNVKRVLDGNVDGSGQISKTKTIPPALAGRRIAIQAANVIGVGGASSEKSNPIERVIQ